MTRTEAAAMFRGFADALDIGDDARQALAVSAVCEFLRGTAQLTPREARMVAERLFDNPLRQPLYVRPEELRPAYMKLIAIGSLP